MVGLGTGRADEVRFRGEFTAAVGPRCKRGKKNPLPFRPCGLCENIECRTRRSSPRNGQCQRRPSPLILGGVLAVPPNQPHQHPRPAVLDDTEFNILLKNAVASFRFGERTRRQDHQGFPLGIARIYLPNFCTTTEACVHHAGSPMRRPQCRCSCTVTLQLGWICGNHIASWARGQPRRAAMSQAPSLSRASIRGGSQDIGELASNGGSNGWPSRLGIPLNRGVSRI